MSAIEQVKGLPVIGSLLPFAKDPLSFITQAASRGDLVTYRIVEHTIVQLNHPDLVEQVLVDLAKHMHKDAIYEFTKPLLGEGLVTSEDEVWRRHRKLMAPFFTPRHVDGYANTFVALTSEWLAGLKDGETRDAHKEMMALTQRIVLSTLFGEDLSVDTSAAAHAIEVVMEGFVFDVQGPGRVLPAFLPMPARRRAAAAIEQLDQILYRIIAERRRVGLKDDLLSRLLEARDEEGGLSDRELRDQAVTAFVAGHETTAIALTNTLLLMGERPECWDLLAAEVDRVLAGREATAGDFGALTYTSALVTEAMRLIPPVWAIGREAQQDVTIGGHLVEKGTQVLVPLWSMHRDARFFPDPERFLPERWLDGLRERLPRMAYLPFGGGPRICIGYHFAMLEAVLLLATIAKRFRLLASGPRPRLMPSVTLRPLDEVPIRAVAR